VLIEWEIQEANFDPADPYHYDEDDDDGWAGLPIRPWQSAPSYWLPIGWRPGVAGRLHVDLLPGPTGQIGQLVGEDIHGMSKWIAANSFTGYLTHLSNELEAGRVCVFTDKHTQQQDWRCLDGRPFVAPGFAKVFG
jgi:cell wall assembly regulator SMI1